MTTTKKKKAQTKSTVEKPRCSGTLTESQFWSMIRSHLRRLTLRWKPRNDYLLSIRTKYTGSNKRLKYVYTCDHCRNDFPRKEVEADHILECGSLRNSGDLKGFIERLLVEIDGWRCLCKPCHKKRTAESRRAKCLTE